MEEDIKKKYKKVLGYARSLDPEFCKDLVHDAYLDLKVNTGQDMFKVHEGVMFNSVKLRHRANYTRSTFMWNGITSKKEYLPMYEQDMPPNNIMNPEHLLIIKDIKQQLAKTLTPKQNEIVELKQAGYKLLEIAEKFDMSEQLMRQKYNISKIKTNFNKLNV